MQNDTLNPNATATKALEVQPYVFLGGRCEEALAFYKEKIGAEVECMMRFSDCPEPLDSEACKPESMDKIMHAQFSIGQSKIFASDGCVDDKSGTTGFSLSISVGSDSDAERIFEGLSDGGEVQMPMDETFFATRFGMVVDKFGVGWMVLNAKECG